MRASRHAHRIRAWLEDAGKVAMQGQKGGGCLSAVINLPLTSQEDPPLCAARLLSTSSATCSYKGFARVLRQPVPKSVVFNRRNLKVWLRSRLDVGMAGQLMQLQLQKGNPSEAAAHKRAQKLMAQAGSLRDLSDFVQHLGPHIAPGQLAGACAHAANILQTSAVACAGSTQHALVYKDAWPLLALVLQHLEPQLHQLSLTDMSTLLYGLSRAHYPLPSHTKEVICKELLDRISPKPSELNSRTLASLLLSGAMLGLQGSGEGHLWRQLTSAAATDDHVDGMDVVQLSHVIQGLGRSGDHNNQLWGPVLRALKAGMAAWLQTKPDQLATALQQVALSGNSRAMQQLGSPGVRAWLAHHDVASLLQLPARTLVHLAQFSAAASKLHYVQARAQDLMLMVCAAVGQHVTRLGSQDLQSLLAALSTTGKQGDPLVRLAADVLRVRGFAGLGPVPAAAILAHLADLHHFGRDLCRSMLPEALAALPSLPPSALANLAWAYAHMATPSDAHQLVPAAAAHLLESSRGASLPAFALARACVACNTLQQGLHISDAGSSPVTSKQQQQQQQQEEEMQKLAGLTAQLGKQLSNVDNFAGYLSSSLAARLQVAVPELLRH